jgi:hypothetical protein
MGHILSLLIVSEKSNCDAFMENSKVLDVNKGVNKKRGIKLMPLNYCK